MAKPQTERDYKVLVADDELTIRKIVKAVLNSMGIRDITECSDGKDAYDTLKLPKASTGEKKRRYDFIICDWMMPHMTGIELLEKLRGEASFKNFPFLMLTAEADSDRVVKAIEKGVTDYCVKPFTSGDLEKKIRKVMAKIP